MIRLCVASLIHWEEYQFLVFQVHYGSIGAASRGAITFHSWGFEFHQIFIKRNKPT